MDDVSKPTGHLGCSSEMQVPCPTLTRAVQHGAGRPVLLTRVIFWTYLVYILILVSIAYAYRDLPSEQSKYTTQAVACAVWRDEALHRLGPDPAQAR